MDWLLSATTLLANSYLGWSGGTALAWALHAANSALWVYYAWRTNQYGLLPLAGATILIDAVSGF